MILSIWFGDPTSLSTGIGLLTAGLAFALQKVITALRLVILRGDTFRVGDRITIAWRTRRRQQARFYPDDDHGVGQRPPCSLPSGPCGQQPPGHRSHRHGHQRPPPDCLPQRPRPR